MIVVDSTSSEDGEEKVGILSGITINHQCPWYSREFKMLFRLEAMFLVIFVTKSSAPGSTM